LFSGHCLSVILLFSRFFLFIRQSIISWGKTQIDFASSTTICL
jgi:hypothetical protein